MSVPTPRDYATYADAIDALRLKLRQDGPASGLHRQEAAAADRLLADVRDVMREIADRRQARLERENCLLTGGAA